MKVRFLSISDMARDCKRAGIPHVRLEFSTVLKNPDGVPAKEFWYNLTAASQEKELLYYHRQMYHWDFVHDIDEKKKQEVLERTDQIEADVVKAFDGLEVIRGGMIEEL